MGAFVGTYIITLQSQSLDNYRNSRGHYLGSSVLAALHLHRRKAIMVDACCTYYDYSRIRAISTQTQRTRGFGKVPSADEPSVEIVLRWVSVSVLSSLVSSNHYHHH